MLPQRCQIQLTPLPTAARVAKQRAAWKLHAVLSALSLGVLLLLWIGPLKYLTAGWPSSALVGLAVLWALGTGIRIGITCWALQRAKRDLAAIGDGAALFIDGTGVEFLHPVPVSATWAEITALKLAGSSLGAGPELIMEVADRPVARIPLSFVDAMPSAIDSAVLGFSGGRVRLDVSAMDKMI